MINTIHWAATPFLTTLPRDLVALARTIPVNPDYGLGCLPSTRKTVIPVRLVSCYSAVVGGENAAY